MNSENMFPVSQFSTCEKTGDHESDGNTEPQFAPITPAKLDTLSQQHTGEVENAKGNNNSPSSQEESCVENPLDGGNGNGNGNGIDLNKTPRQKKPRKKRHRPKLVKEGEQYNFPKSATPKQKASSTKETKKPKKKYVRKNAGAPDNKIDGGDRCAKVKSCKRSLNFDVEEQGGESISKKKAKDTCGEVMLDEHPTRRQLLKANLKVLGMLRDEENAREKNGDGEKKDQDRMWQGYVPTPPKHNEVVRNNKSSVTGLKGKPNVVKMFKPLINDLVRRFKSLSITRDKVPRNRQDSLVLYKGDNQIALYQGKKPKPFRGAVDLDMETIRAWNLLMGIEAGEGVEGNDDDKEKWWEEERRIFRERVDSFITRMHFILGDRRFSPWNGSVVDSVVGVFLTQNVSDHLSSSAFMSLMARFPPKSTETIHKKTNMKVEVPEEEKELVEIVKSDSTESNNILKQKTNIANAKGKVNWDDLRKEVYKKHGKKERNHDTMDSVDWEAVLHAKQSEVSEVIEKRGQHNILANKIQEFLKRLVKEHEKIDLEWLRDVHPDKAKEFLLSFNGLGLKSVDCISLLNLHHHAFPVDTNIQRIAVRLGWAPLQPLPEGIQLHDLKAYPEMGDIQKYLWPRLYTLNQDLLYELHYQMITFGKVFCSKNMPNCNACPMRPECKHFASAFASTASSRVPTLPNQTSSIPETNLLSKTRIRRNVSEPIIEEPASPELDFDEVPDIEDAWWQENTKDNCYQDPIVEEPTSPELHLGKILGPDIEDACWQKDTEDNCYEDPDGILSIKLNTNDSGVNSQDDNQANMDLEGDMLMMLSSEAASVPIPKLKNVRRLRTEHQVYQLPDDHVLLDKLEKRIPGDVCQYLLAILPTTDETAETNNQTCCDSQKLGNMCDNKESSSCRSTRKANSGTVKGILLIPSRTAMRGFFPLNGTYFQVNEVFVDHASCLHPIDVPRKSIYLLKKRTVYCGTSIPSIFKDMTTAEVQNCFWNGFVCVRSFDQLTRLPYTLRSPMHGSENNSAAKSKEKGTETRSPAKTKGKRHGTRI